MHRSSDLETGVLYCDDNLERLARLPSESVDLIYLDPPFFSNRDYEVIWGDEAEVRSFEDRWEGGMNHYVGWMRERIMEMSRVLKPTGSIYLHCDQTASHYLKVMMDSVFGLKSFRNQIVWRRTPSKGLMTRRLARNHDILLSYQMSDDATWNNDAAFTAYDPNALDEKTASKYRYRDEDGRLYRLDNLANPNPDRPGPRRKAHARTEIRDSQESRRSAVGQKAQRGRIFVAHCPDLVPSLVTPHTYLR